VWYSKCGARHGPVKMEAGLKSSHSHIHTLSSVNPLAVEL
jgi:hypothetical protein